MLEGVNGSEGETLFQTGPVLEVRGDELGSGLSLKKLRDAAKQKAPAAAEASLDTAHGATRGSG